MLLYEELRRGPLEAKVRTVKGQYNSFSLSPKFKNLLFWQRPTKVHFFLHKVDVESSWGFLPQLACLHSHPLSDEGGIKCILVHTLYCFLHLLRKEIIPFAQLAWRALVSETVWFGGSDLQDHSPLHAVFWFPVGVYGLFGLQVQCFAPDKCLSLETHPARSGWSCFALSTEPMSSGRMDGACRDQPQWNVSYGLVFTHKCAQLELKS